MENVFRLIPTNDQELETFLRSDARTWVMLGFLFGKGMTIEGLPPDLKPNEARTVVRVAWNELKMRERKT